VHPKGMPDPTKRGKVPLSHFIGDQMKNSARKVKNQQLMVGSFQINPKKKGGPSAPRGIGDQAAPHYGQDNGSNFYNHLSRKDRKTQKLLVGSTFVDPKAKDQHHSRGFGNQAAQMQGPDGTGNPNFYNAPSHKDKKTQKLLVGSYNVDQNHKAMAHPGIGNQAAPQSHMDVGTNIVFHGVKSEGGIRGAKKHMQKKGLVGSHVVQKRADGKASPHQPHGFGDQSASRGNNPGFYNAPSH